MLQSSFKTQRVYTEKAKEEQVRVDNFLSGVDNFLVELKEAFRWFISLKKAEKTMG
jgi:hypothetical protein